MMTIEDKTPGTPKWVRKLLIPGLIGAVAGFAASTGTLAFLDSGAVGGIGESATVAVLVGMLYALIGLGMGVGVANPRIGARFLNVEDEDELREQKRMLGLSGLAMLLWGAALIALALAAPGGPVPAAVALAIGAGGLVSGSLLSVAVYRACDELMRAVNLEAGALSYGLVLLVAGGWAMLAHLGYAAAPAPLDLLTLLYVLVLLASFIVVGRRGMLAPR
ncbi:hypothetical protein ACLBKU_01415 [Erythrobacter sp. NE805]|uniref:hypothetical protein n=1 Tax=Erythrobacter sp. NE805 TaxID=3389875 RepID=UPI00396B3C2E